MRKFLSLLLVLMLIPFVVPGRVKGISDVKVTVNPSYRLDYGEYKITFVTGSDLTGGIDNIYLKFPLEATIPCTSCAYGGDRSRFKINGHNAANAALYAADPSKKTIYLTMPGGITVKKGDKIEIVIAQGANFQNPSMPGKYTLTIWTDREVGKFQAEFEIISTKVQDLTVSNDPETSGLIATYKIAFKTGNKGSLINGQNIYVEFPEGIHFPTVPHKNAITINSENPKEISLQENIFTLELAYSINASRDVLIYFLGSFGLENPEKAGTYKLNIWTDTEPEHVSAEFTVKAQKAVSTQIEVSPQAPDGTNGFYRTEPTVTLLSETNTGETIETFFKIDSDEYKTYTSPVTISEGIHTFSYYSKTQTLKESEKSVIFKVDFTPPEIKVEVPPEDPYYTGDQKLMLFGSISESAQIIVSSAVVQQNPNGSFAREITLVPGENTIQIRATDLAGNMSVKLIKVVFDTTVPVLTITSPMNWEKISTKEISVKGNVYPANTDVYVLNNKIKVNEDGSFEFSFVPQNSGTLIPVNIRATYPFSKKTVEKTITVVYEPKTLSIMLTVDKKVAIVEGVEKIMDVAPFIDKNSNRTLVPIRFVSEFLGGTVDWNATTRTVTIKFGKNINNEGLEIELTIGNTALYVNGKEVKTDVAPLIKDSRTFVPLRFIAETMGFNVEWNSANRSIAITTP
jgi:hypothetical protein